MTLTKAIKSCKRKFKYFELSIFNAGNSKMKFMYSIKLNPVGKVQITSK